MSNTGVLALCIVASLASFASGATVVYQEGFESGFSPGALSGQNGWSGGGQQVAGSPGDYRTQGNNSDQPTTNSALYSIPTTAVSVIIESRMRLRGGYSNIMGPVDAGGDALFQYGANWNSANFRVRDENGADVVLTNVSGGNALSGSSHAYYDIRFIADLNGASPATGLFQVRKDGQAGYSTVASGIPLNLTAGHEDPASWTGLFVRGRTSSDQTDSLSVAYVDAKSPTATVLADSVHDWKGAAALPHGQWSYGRYAGASNWQSFVENTTHATYGSWIGGDGNTWQVPAYPQLGQYAAAPSNGEWAVRRWTSDTEGEVTVYYDAQRLQSGSTGQIVGIYQNGKQVWSQGLDNSNVHFMGRVGLTVHPGDQIDFVIDPKGNNNSDWTHYSARIENGPPHSNPGLVAHWALDERSDMPIANPDGEPYNRRATVGDSSGNNNHVYTHNTWSNERVSGLIGNALEFHNGTGYGVSYSSKIADGASELTLSAWIRPDGKDNWDGILTTKAQVTSPDKFTGLALADYNSQGYYAPTFRVMNAGNVTSTIDTPVGEWSHVVAVWKSGELHRIYINGELGANNDAGAYAGLIDMDQPWYIGTDRLISNRYFDGLIDDVGIWTRALSEFEIRQIYMGGLIGIDLAHADIVDVPEPVTVSLLSMGTFALGGYLRRRRKMR